MEWPATGPRTLAQKLVARAAGRGSVVPGEIVTCRVDLAMFHDSSGPRRLAPLLAELGAPIWDKDKVVLVIDHYVPERDDDARRIVRIARQWAAEQGLPHVHDSQGICHVVLPQQGHLRPGMFCVGGDSHSPTGGAFGAYMFGIGATEMLGVLVTGEIWLRVPDTIFMQWHGQLADGVSAKDMVLAMLGRHGLDGGRYQAIEFCGSAVRALGMQERMTLSNMSAELGAQAGLIAPDDTTRTWLAAHGAPDAGTPPTPWFSDADAAGTRHDHDASTLAPQVAVPHSPADVHGVDALAGTRIDVAYIGACTGAKLADLRAAARVLAGKRIAAGVQLLVAPASVMDAQAAEREGVLGQLRAAGATLLPSSCGACAGYGSRIPDGSSVISSTARNFKGRMGSDTAQVYLGSPYTVAASALRGTISDARDIVAWWAGMRTWKLPADVDTDQLAPGATMQHGIEVTARHCLQALRPAFAAGVRPGDVVVAGPHFGIGSSREQAATVLVHLGVAAVVAPSYAGLYFRNAFNVGLLLLSCPQAALLDDGESITVDARAGRITRGNGSVLDCDPIPGFLLDMVEAGGLLPQLKSRLKTPPCASRNSTC